MIGYSYVVCECPLRSFNIFGVRVLRRDVDSLTFFPRPTRTAEKMLENQRRNPSKQEFLQLAPTFLLLVCRIKKFRSCLLL